MENYLIKNLLVLVLSLVFLNACSTTSRQSTDGVVDNSSKQANWNTRQKKLAALSKWHLNGRASVTYQGENWPFGIDWQQQSLNQYTMKIKHPLTQNQLADIVKTSSSVSLNNNGRVYRDSSAENLIEKHLRVKLPVSGMKYWVLGTRSPGSPLSMVKLDGLGRPTMLQQMGWTISYPKYQSNKLDALPTLIKITRSSPQAVQVKMLIRQWN